MTEIQENINSSRLNSVTIPQPFKLSHLKQKTFLLPYLVERKNHYKVQRKLKNDDESSQVPTTCGSDDSSEESDGDGYSPTEKGISLSKLEEKRLKRLEKTKIETQNKYLCPPPPLHTSVRTVKKDRTAEVEAQIIKELTFQPAKCKPAPVYNDSEGEVIWNAARVYQADKVITKIEEATSAKLKDFFITGRDETEFLNWKQAEDQKEDAQNLLIRAVRKTELQRLKDRIQANVDSLAIEKRKIVVEARENETDRQRKLAEELETSEKKKRQHINNMKIWNGTLEERKKQNIEEKAGEAHKLREELKELRFWHTKEKEVELEELKEHARSIREEILHSESKNRVPVFDRDEIPRTSAVVMEQMSINEMFRRIESEKDQQRATADSIRKRNLENKNERCKKILEKANRIQNFRQTCVTKKQSALESEVLDEYRQLEALKQHNDNCLVKCAEKIFSKRTETYKDQLKLHKEHQLTLIKKPFLTEGVAAIEESIFTQQVLAKQRQDSGNQREWLKDLAVKSKVEEQAHSIRNNAKNAQKARQNAIRESYDADLEHSKQVASQINQNEKFHLTQIHDQVRSRMNSLILKRNEEKKTQSIEKKNRNTNQKMTTISTHAGDKEEDFFLSKLHEDDDNDRNLVSQLV